MSKDNGRAKRVAVALDVLKHLKYLNLSTTSYLSGKVPNLKRGEEGRNAQSILPKLQKHCEVCAKGAMFLSHIRLYDKVSFGDLKIYENSIYLDGDELYVDDLTMMQKTEDYFSPSSQDLIETAYQKCGFGRYDNGMKYFCDIEDKNERLKAIMLNVVANGDFVPKNGIPASLREAKASSKAAGSARGKK